MKKIIAVFLVLSFQVQALEYKVFDFYVIEEKQPPKKEVEVVKSEGMSDSVKKILSTSEVELVPESETPIMNGADPDPALSDEAMNLAIIDGSLDSIKWLSPNVNYLVAQNIPVMVINSDEVTVAKIKKQWPELMIGLAPTTNPKLMEYFAQQNGIKYYPAVIEGNLVWQQRRP